jgi:hypothetical protein
MVFCIVLGFYLLLRARARGAGRSTDAAPLAEPSAVPDAAEPRAASSTASNADAAAAGVVAAPVERWTGGPLTERLRGWLLPLSGIEIAAGAAFVVATGIKASGGVLIPVVLAGLLRTPRRLTQVLIGMALATLLTAAASLLAFGVHIPDLSTQSSLVTDVSVPNLIGLAIGAGGETKALHDLLTVALALSVLACCAQAWRRGAAVTASGWASVALLVTLSWVLPWYVLWVLPMAALSSSRRLRATALAIGVYMIVAWAPASGYLWDAIGFHPEKTSLGRLHQRYVKELLD